MKGDRSLWHAVDEYTRDTSGEEECTVPEPRSLLLRQLLEEYPMPDDIRDPMPDDTRDPNRRDEWVNRGKEMQDLAEHLRMLRTILPLTEGSISTAAQHIVNLTDAVQSLLLWVTGEHPEL